MTAASGMRSDPSNVQARRSTPEVMSKRPSLRSKHWLAKSISDAVSASTSMAVPRFSWIQAVTLSSR